METENEKKTAEEAIIIRMREIVDHKGMAM